MEGKWLIVFNDNGRSYSPFFYLFFKTFLALSLIEYKLFLKEYFGAVDGTLTSATNKFRVYLR